MSGTRATSVEAEFVWVADQAALDFLNTRYPLKGELVETLASAEALRRWLVEGATGAAGATWPCAAIE